MAKKKEQGIEVIETPVVESHVVPELSPDVVVRVINKGKPFVVDLTGFGYGMRWPTNAVYNLPMRVYLECLKNGLDGANA